MREKTFIGNFLTKSFFSKVATYNFTGCFILAKPYFSVDF